MTNLLNAHETPRPTPAAVILPVPKHEGTAACDQRPAASPTGIWSAEACFRRLPRALVYPELRRARACCNLLPTPRPRPDAAVQAHAASASEAPPAETAYRARAAAPVEA